MLSRHLSFEEIIADLNSAKQTSTTSFLILDFLFFKLFELY